MRKVVNQVVKPSVEECSVYLVAERVDGKPIWLSCKVKRDGDASK